MSLSASTSEPAAALGRLPSGRHRIPDHQVREHQHARLIEAICALCAQRGYANVVISDIVACAGVSKSTFYRFYRSVEECLFDAHKRHCAALIAALDRSCAGGERSSASSLRIGIRSALTHLTANPQSAHLLTIGILSCGPRGERRYAVMIDALSARVHGAGDALPADSALTAVLFAASTIAHTILSRDEFNLLALENELVEMFLAIGERNEPQRTNRTTAG
jgi:AcrR family transcriptional regulator